MQRAKLRWGSRPLWKLQLRPQDLVEDLAVIGAGGGKGEVADHELIEANAKAPQIRHGGVALTQDHLGGHEHGSALQGAVASVGYATCNAKVDDLQIALLVYEAVLTLQVQVSNASKGASWKPTLRFRRLACRNSSASTMEPV